MSDDSFAPSANELVSNNKVAAASFADKDLPVAPTRNLAVVACMDCRVDVYQILGVRNGEAHIIRNGGGVITDDVIRSLCLSQRKLGTREIMLMHHSNCGLQTIDDSTFKDELEAELGIKPTWAVESFKDPYADVEQSMQRIMQSPFLPHKDHVRGFVYDVDTGLLNEVTSE